MSTAAAEIELDARREKLITLYGDALEKALYVVESLQAAIDRLVEIDAGMISYAEGE